MKTPDLFPTFGLLFIFACCKATLRADPPPGGKWQPIPELTDEFKGNKLDSTKWHDHNPGWKGREPGFFSANMNAHVLYTPTENDHWSYLQAPWEG